MDRLTIFPQPVSEVSLRTSENNTIDTVVEELGEVARELKLTRKGHEEWTWGESVSEAVEEGEIDMGDDEE